jgi:glycosyltransferase involved in cell wall biosynthesis
MRGRKIVWTVHNLYNHEHKRLWLDHWHSRLTARAAHALLVHGERARCVVMQTFNAPSHKIHVTPHGNYAAMVPAPLPPVARGGVRFLYFGAIRPYKGIDALLNVFGDLRGPHTLHIAGSINNTALATEITRQATKDPRVRLTLEFIPDEMLAHFLAECDVVVMPYLDILTSGSLLMALSAARPSIAPRLGIIEDYTRDDISFLYDVADPKGLAGALHHASISQDLPERGLRAHEQSKRFDWCIIGQDLAHLYHHISV